MKNLLAAVAFVACAVAFAPSAGAQPTSIWGITEDAKLLIINPSTGAAKIVGTGGFPPLESIEEDPLRDLRGEWRWRETVRRMFPTKARFDIRPPYPTHGETPKAP